MNESMGLAPELNADTLPVLREQMRAAGDALSRPRVLREDLFPEGIPVRLHRPESTTAEGLQVFIHGGAWVFGDLETHDAVCARLAHESGQAVLAIGYRLAPEHPFPAGLEDCDTVLQWAMTHAATLGIAADRISIGGESAGANLAAAVTLRRKARNAPQPQYQLLVHPALDMQLTSPSSRDVLGPGISREYCLAVRDLYLPDPADITSPLASPLLAADLSGLPPAIILTAEVDPLRDDGQLYAERLRVSGVETRFQQLEGLPHGFMGLPFETPVIAKAYRLMASLMRRYNEHRRGTL